jgi:hypothetical protein
VSLLEAIWFRGKVRSKMLRHDQVQNQNIVPWHNLCEITWIYQLLTEVGLKASVPAKLWCDNQAALLHLILFSMNELSTLKLIVISSVRKYSKV